MRNILTIMRREFKAYFVSPVAYVILASVLFILGLFFYGMVEAYSRYSLQLAGNPMYAGQINLHDFVIRGFYSTFGFIMLFVAPIVSMRVLAEEKRQGTAEMLLTSPVTTSQLVVGKYLGALSFGLFLILITLQYPLFLLFMGARPELPALLAAYVGSVLLLGALLAVGLFSSSLTSSQIVAAVIAFVLSLFLWVIGFLGEIVGQGSEYSDLLKALSINEHFEEFLKGVVDTGAVVFFLTFIAFMLFMTQRVVDSSRWR
ncbi:MAG TPA: ABC transporter permease [Patescibacteria group bacterium]|jgi:ABC-2 type transport system permease protein|nr:ABC transporter permease [Patescibacteria group bacterium]